MKYIRRIGLVTSLLAPLACGSDDSTSQTADASSSGTAGTSSGAAGEPSGSGGTSAGAGGDSAGGNSVGGASGCPDGQIFCVQGCNGGGHCTPINECAITNVFCLPKVDAAVDDAAK